MPETNVAAGWSASNFSSVFTQSLVVASIRLGRCFCQTNRRQKLRRHPAQSPRSRRRYGPACSGLELPCPQINIDRVTVSFVRQHQRFHHGFLFRLRIRSKKFQVFRPQPAAQIALSKDRRASLGKDSISASVVQVVMRVHHKANGQVRDLADFRQQVRAGATSSNVSTTTTPLLPIINPALLPAFPPSAPIAA